MTVFLSQITYAQTVIEGSDVDPRLEELVQIVKSRAEAPERLRLRPPANQLQDAANLDLVQQLQTASYSSVPQTIFDSVSQFNKNYESDGSLALGNIVDLYTEYAQGLEDGLNFSELQTIVSENLETGNWFEKFIALEHSSYLHSSNRELQSALQKAQLALSVIPEVSEANLFAGFAKSKITSSIAHLHNLQGNSSLALTSSLEYLKLTEDNPNPKDEIDLINNLIYAYGISRNHDAQLFLSEQLLDLEQVRSSSVPGLSEMRIADVMNDAGRFEKALDYTKKANAKAEHPAVIRNSQIAQAVALTGLGRTYEARRVAKKADVDLSPENILKAEKSKHVLYLAFLLAQNDDTDYATQVFNRHLDVMARGFISNNSRDTTVMLAELENTRERQAERDAASAREANLQALTIHRQRNLNRALIILLIILGGAALGAICFARFRTRMVRELEIKTKEAASAEQLKADFLGMISHELRTPLNGIIGISDFLANNHVDPDIREKTGIILRSGNDLFAVVESLTDMARLEAGQLALVPFNADLSQSLAEIPKRWTPNAKAKGLALTSFIDPDITQHHVDELRLLQCLNILVTNAISFTDVGRVHLHITANKDAKNNVIGLTAIVADTGQGMNDVVQSRLFTPFMQADASRKRTHMGTGLSLAIAHELINMMGGKLSVVSREGRGSEFTINVPLEQAKHILPASDGVEVLETVVSENDMPTRESTVSETPFLEGPDAPQREFVDLMQAQGDQRGLHDLNADKAVNEQSRILIIDNQSSDRESIKSMFTAQGHICVAAIGSESSFEKLEQARFDFIVLDIQMTPLQSLETLRLIRGSEKSYANLPVIVLTADNDADMNAVCMDTGADLFLTKPVESDELSRAIIYLDQEQKQSALSA